MRSRKLSITLSVAVLLIVTSACSLPVEGTWSSAQSKEQDGGTFDAQMIYSFSPKTGKAGDLQLRLTGKLTIDSLGDINFNFEAPGSYYSKKNTIYIVYDTTRIEANSAFHPTSFWGLLGSGAVNTSEIEQSLKHDFLSEKDTLHNVKIVGKEMKLVRGEESLTFLKEEQ